MSRWRPSPGEERWLEVAATLGAAVPRAAVAERTGGWRSTGPLARIALFVLGLVAAGSCSGSSASATRSMLLVAGLIAALAAEWLTVEQRLHASGIEEGLCVAGFLMIGAWIVTLMEPQFDLAGARAATLVLIAAAGAAGLRLLNPLVTTGAVLAFVYWVDSSAIAHALDQGIGGGVTALTFGCALAALALALGAREYRRPSHDRMLDWLVATLPVAAYAQHASWNAYDVVRGVERRRHGPACDRGVAARARRGPAGHRPAPEAACATTGLHGLRRRSRGGAPPRDHARDGDVAHPLRARGADRGGGPGSLPAAAAQWPDLGGTGPIARDRSTCCRVPAPRCSRSAPRPGRATWRRPPSPPLLPARDDSAAAAQAAATEGIALARPR